MLLLCKMISVQAWGWPAPYAPLNFVPELRLKNEAPVLKMRVYACWTCLKDCFKLVHASCKPYDAKCKWCKLKAFVVSACESLRPLMISPSALKLTVRKLTQHASNHPYTKLVTCLCHHLGRRARTLSEYLISSSMLLLKRKLMPEFSFGVLLPMLILQLFVCSIHYATFRTYQPKIYCLTKSDWIRHYYLGRSLCSFFLTLYFP